MQSNGTKVKQTEDLGRVSRVSGTGFKIDGREGWYSFPKSGEREEPFEIPMAGDFIEYRYIKDEVGNLWVHAINVLSRWEPPKGGLPLNYGERKNLAKWSKEREERLMRLLEIAAQNYSGRAMGPEDLMRDAILLERELVRALKNWSKA